MTTAHRQFSRFKTLPELPSASTTPRTRREASKSSYQSQIFPNNETETSESNKSKFGVRFLRKKTDTDMDNIEKSLSKKYHSLFSSKEQSISLKSIPHNIKAGAYAHISEDDEEEEDDEDDDERVLSTNIPATTDVSTRLKVFRRKRGVPKTAVDEAYDDGYKRYNVDTTELSHITATSKLTQAPSHTNGSCLSSTKYSHYSMRDELNLQKIIINTTVEMHAALPQSTDVSEGETQTKTHIETNDAFESDAQYDEHKRRSMRNKAKQYETTHGFEFYVNLRNMVSLLTLVAIGTMQYVYYRYYYLCGVFTSITALFYIMLFIPRVYRNITPDCLCSFGLIVVRLFHMMSILTVFVGVETCLFHYERVVHSTQDNGDTDIWIALLWTCIIAAIIMCYLQNVYVIKYDEFIVVKWKLVYCCKAKYYINEDGSWRADLNPISGGDGLLTSFLFITTFAAVISSVVCIHKLEMIMKIYGA